jgi:hypothetical protein
MKLSRSMSHAESDAVSELSDQSLLAVFGGAAPTTGSEPPPANGTLTTRGDNTTTTNTANSNPLDPIHRTDATTTATTTAGTTATNANTITKTDIQAADKASSLTDRSHDPQTKSPDSYEHHHQTPMEALDHGIHQIADGIADLAVALIGSLPHHHGWHGVGLDFGGKGRSGRG